MEDNLKTVINFAKHNALSRKKLLVCSYDQLASRYKKVCCSNVVYQFIEQGNSDGQCMADHGLRGTWMGNPYGGKGCADNSINFLIRYGGNQVIQPSVYGSNQIKNLL